MRKGNMNEEQHRKARTQGGKPSSSYGSVAGVELAGSVGGHHRGQAPDDAGTPRFQDDPEEEDFFALIKSNENDGSSLAWRWGVFLTRPRWWFAVVVLVTLYTLYTNQPTEISNIPEPGYVLEPNVYETKWWARWWSPWGEATEAILDAVKDNVELAANETGTYVDHKTSSSSSSSDGGGGGKSSVGGTGGKQNRAFR